MKALLVTLTVLVAAAPALARDPNCRPKDEKCELLQGFSALQLVNQHKGEDAAVRCAVKTGQPKPSDPRNRLRHVRVPCMP